MDRQAGATTIQMKEAPKGALFVWVNHHLAYPKALARRLARDDLKIVSPDFLAGSSATQSDWPAVVVDHAARLTSGQADALGYIRARATRLNAFPDQGEKP